MTETNTVAIWRPFKFPSRKIVDSDFIPSRKEENEKFMLEDLKASGLVPEDVGAHVHGKLAMPAGFQAGYIIGYTNPEGGWLVDDDQQLTMYRIKLQPSPGVATRRKYDQPNSDELAEHGFQGSMPYIPPSYHTNPKSPTLVICEGEKKAACVGKYLGYSAIGIGGCWSWRDGTGEGAVHPWIVALARTHSDVLIVPDGDYRRYDIAKAYGTFCSELRAALEEWPGKVQILACPDKIDDLIVKWGPEAQGNFDALSTLEPSELVEDPMTLMRQYKLAFKVDNRGNPHLYEHSYNIQKLIEEHPAFPKIWLDLDTHKTMLGEEVVVMGRTEVEIANHFQYNFQMPTVDNRKVSTVLQALQRQNEHSPFLEWIDSLVWDGKPRLDTWMVENWGIKDNPYTREVSSKFLIASVARQREPGAKVDWMLITTGKQGTGKSTMPEILFPGNTINIVGSHTDRDVQLMMHSGLCVILDELAALNAKEADFWKSAITTREDRFRLPYGRDVEFLKRRSILYGTTNVSSFLDNDLSGFRRYKPVEINQWLNFDRLTRDMPQLWAEASHRHKSGADWNAVLNPDDMYNHVTNDATQERILNWLQTLSRSNPTQNSQFLGKLKDVGDIMEFRLMDVSDGAGLENTTQKKARSRVEEYIRAAGGEKRSIGKLFLQKCYRFSGEALEQLRKPTPERMED